MITIMPNSARTAQVMAPPKPRAVDDDEYADPFRPATEDDFAPRQAIEEAPPPVPAEPAEPPRPWEFSDEETRGLEPIPEPTTEPEPAPPTGEVKPLSTFTFLPFAPTPDADKMPVDPSTLVDVGTEVEIPTTPIEDANQSLNVREMIFYSLNNSTPMRIAYTTLYGGTNIERTIHPDYVYWSGTNRHILVAWDEEQADWRAFSVDNINAAKLMEQTS